MLIECHNCGAPLDVADGVASVRCHYCGQTSETGRFKTVALQTPQGWVPPPQWTPPVGSFIPPEPHADRPISAARRAPCSGGSGSRPSWATLALGGFIASRVMSAVSDAGLGALTQSGQVQNAMGQALSAMNALSNSALNTAGDTLPIV